MASQHNPTGFGPPELEAIKPYLIYNYEDNLVLDSGLDVYYLQYDSETGRRTTGR
jgi:hypothetical protein